MPAPPPITRQGAGNAARRELERPEYHRDDPSLLHRLLSWFLGRIGDLVARSAAATPGGYWGLLLLLVLVVAGVVALRVRLGRLPAPDLLGGFGRGRGSVTPQVLRARADAAAARGDHAEAIRLRTRAVVAGLQERGLVDRQPGRTLTGVVATAAARLPAAAAELAVVATIFDATWYADVPADAAAYARLTAADERIAASRAAVLTSP